MAVDFSLLPSEKPLPENSPSRLVWTITFFVLVLAGVFAVLLLWPKTLPTQTWEFWTCVVVFPLGVSTLVVMRRFAHYEGHKLNIVLSNEAARGYNAHVFEVASRPLALVGAAYRFSVDPKEDAVESVRAGSVQLKTMAPLARDGEPTKARWLEVPGVNLHPGTKEHDRRRQRDVMKWLFAELINPLVAQVQTLPSGLDLRVHLLVSGEMTYTESEALWQECWREHSLRQVVVTEMTAPDDAEAIDVWLDHVSEGRRLEARLIVAIQLRRLLSAMPPAGGAEAGVALLLLPDVMASQYEVVRMANLHRPVRGPFDQSNNALLHALMWADVAAADISGGWQTALNAAQAGQLREPAVGLGMKTRATDLDQTVGNAGVAAPWLAIACAARSLSSDTQSQIIFAGSRESVDCAVLKHVSQETPRD